MGLGSVAQTKCVHKKPVLHVHVNISPRLRKPKAQDMFKIVLYT